MLFCLRVSLIGVLAIDRDILLDAILRADDIIVVDLFLELFDLRLALDLFILRLLFDFTRLFIHFDDALQ